MIRRLNCGIRKRCYTIDGLKSTPSERKQTEVDDGLYKPFEAKVQRRISACYCILQSGLLALLSTSTNGRNANHIVFSQQVIHVQLLLAPRQSLTCHCKSP